MAVLKILVLFLIFGNREKLAASQTSEEYDYYPDGSSEFPESNSSVDIGLTHVRTKNLSGNVKLTTLEVLTTNPPLDELSTESDTEDMEKPSENKQQVQTIPENPHKSLLSELRTKAPTDGTESLGLMDVSNSTSGTLLDQTSTEKLITVMSLNIELIRENSESTTPVELETENSVKFSGNESEEVLGANSVGTADSENSTQEGTEAFIDAFSGSMTTDNPKENTGFAEILVVHNAESLKKISLEITSFRTKMDETTPTEQITQEFTEENFSGMETSSTFQPVATDAFDSDFKYQSERLNSGADDAFTTPADSFSASEENNTYETKINETETATFQNIQTSAVNTLANLDQSREDIENLSSFMNVDEEFLNNGTGESKEATNWDKVIEDIASILNKHEVESRSGLGTVTTMISTVTTTENTVNEDLVEDPQVNGTSPINQETTVNFEVIMSTIEETAPRYEETTLKIEDVVTEDVLDEISTVSVSGTTENISEENVTSLDIIMLATPNDDFVQEPKAIDNTTPTNEEIATEENFTEVNYVPDVNSTDQILTTRNELQEQTGLYETTENDFAKTTINAMRKECMTFVEIIIKKCPDRIENTSTKFLESTVTESDEETKMSDLRDQFSVELSTEAAFTTSTKFLESAATESDKVTEMSELQDQFSAELSTETASTTFTDIRESTVAKSDEETEMSEFQDQFSAEFSTEAAFTTFTEFRESTVTESDEETKMSDLQDDFSAELSTETAFTASTKFLESAATESDKVTKMSELQDQFSAEFSTEAAFTTFTEFRESTVAESDDETQMSDLQNNFSAELSTETAFTTSPNFLESAATESDKVTRMSDIQDPFSAELSTETAFTTFTEFRESTVAKSDEETEMSNLQDQFSAELNTESAFTAFTKFLESAATESDKVTGMSDLQDQFSAELSTETAFTTFTEFRESTVAESDEETQISDLQDQFSAEFSTETAFTTFTEFRESTVAESDEEAEMSNLQDQFSAELSTETAFTTFTEFRESTVAESEEEAEMSNLQDQFSAELSTETAFTTFTEFRESTVAESEEEAEMSNLQDQFSAELSTETAFTTKTTEDLEQIYDTTVTANIFEESSVVFSTEQSLIKEENFSTMVTVTEQEISDTTDLNKDKLINNYYKEGYTMSTIATATSANNEIFTMNETNQMTTVYTTEITTLPHENKLQKSDIGTDKEQTVFITTEPNFNAEESDFENITSVKETTESYKFDKEKSEKEEISEESEDKIKQTATTEPDSNEFENMVDEDDEIDRVELNEILSDKENLYNLMEYETDKEDNENEQGTTVSHEQFKIASSHNLVSDHHKNVNLTPTAEKDLQISAEFKERIVHFSVNITDNEISFYIPSNAVLLIPLPNIYNITWRSSNSNINNSLIINLGDSVQLNLVKDNQMHIYKSALSSETENKLFVHKSIILEDGIQVYFSNTDFLKIDQDNEIMFTASALPSSPTEKSTYAAEITGGCIGVFVITSVLVYFVIKKFKGRTRNFKPNGLV